jgi:hypothetical protein
MLGPISAPCGWLPSGYIMTVDSQNQDHTAGVVDYLPRVAREMRSPWLPKPAPDEEPLRADGGGPAAACRPARVPGARDALPVDGRQGYAGCWPTMMNASRSQVCRLGFGDLVPVRHRRHSTTRAIGLLDQQRRVFHWPSQGDALERTVRPTGGQEPTMRGVNTYAGGVGAATWGLAVSLSCICGSQTSRGSLGRSGVRT